VHWIVGCVLFCRRVCFDSGVFLGDIHAILVTRSHCSVSHELWNWLIDLINAEPLIVLDVCLIYVLILFIGSEFKWRLWHCAFSAVFYSFMILSCTLAILQFIRPELFPSTIFQFSCLQSFFPKTNKLEQLNVGLFESPCLALQRLKSVFAVLSTRMLCIDNIEVYLFLWCTKWHWGASCLLFAALAYHSF
jgi:hypothetical protein